MEGNFLRSLAGRCRNGLVHFLLRGARKLSTPDGFVVALNERIADPGMREYLAQLGADRLVDNLYVLAIENDALRDHLLRDAAIRMFRCLYNPALKSAGSREYMIETGLEELYTRVDRMALELGAPLAQRAGGYGQEGEDLILDRLFDGQASGFYVDVGAHHPFRFSNTYLLYQRGWRGINIDAMPGSMAAFQRWRPRDINIEAMVSAEPASHTYYQYGEPALNTISQAVVEKRKVESPQYQVISTVTLQSRPLAGILAEHIPPGTTIDLMSVDVEGLDLEVLASNDWNRFRPRILVVELLWTGFSDMENSEMYRFLTQRGYRLLSKLVNSAIFSL